MGAHESGMFLSVIGASRRGRKGVSAGVSLGVITRVLNNPSVRQIFKPLENQSWPVLTWIISWWSLTLASSPLLSRVGSAVGGHGCALTACLVRFVHGFSRKYESTRVLMRLAVTQLARLFCVGK